MDRKEFLKTLAWLGAASSLHIEGKMAVMAQEGTEGGDIPDLTAVLGGEPVPMFKAGIEAMGGLGRYVKKGDRVVVKPNSAWDRAPELAANTNPDLMAYIVKSCLDLGAQEVVVFDHTCDDWRKSYATSGIEKAVTKAGGKMVPADDEKYYRSVSLPQGKVLKEAKIHQAILDCDVWLNVPILKNHGGAKLSMSMKNYMGIVWDRRVFHREGLPQCIADVCTYEKRPALNIVDAYRIMKSNGPRGMSESDVVLTKGLFISPNIVAVDTAATKFFNQVEKMDVEEVIQLANGEENGLGTRNLAELNVKRIKM